MSQGRRDDVAYQSMSPHLIITDEIGSKEDVSALLEAINAGVRIITTGTR